MHTYFIIEDPESEYYNQVATLIHRSTIGNNLAVYYCKMDDGEKVGLLAYQLGKSFFSRSEADKWKDK